MSKERYLSKEEFKRYEKVKADIKDGKLLNPEGLLYLADSVDNDPTRLGKLLLKKIEQFKEDDQFLKSFTDQKLLFEPVSEEEIDESIPFIEY